VLSSVGVSPPYTSGHPEISAHSRQGPEVDYESDRFLFALLSHDQQRAAIHSSFISLRCRVSGDQANLHRSIRIASPKHDKYTSTESTTSLLPARRRTLAIVNSRPSQLTPQRLDSFSLPLPLLSHPSHLLIPQSTTSSLLILSSFLLFLSLLFPLQLLLSRFGCKKCLVVFFDCLAVGTEGICG